MNLRQPMSKRAGAPWRLGILLAACAALVASPAMAWAPGQVGNHLPAPGPRQFDLEAHRGGLGLVTE
ncbi:MAG: glycerophosphodiester phosphodiesterase, partial [Candidatus Limnocylindria bacterium]